MRSQPFLQWLSQNYNPAVAQAIAGQPVFRGGWEGWLQVEIARTFLANANTICEREMRYPDGNGAYISYAGGVANGGVGAGAAARADFFLQRNAGMLDQTYLELKCSNSLAGNPVQDAWARFDNDIAKITAIAGVNPALNCIALLAYWGQLDPNNAANQGGPNGHPVNWYWGGNRSAYMWDTSINPVQVTTLQTAQQNQQGVLQANRLLIIAVSP
ncbi:MAG TPA: hypothetical protein VMH86_14770 [Rhizomicrobium sp.]|nr:hypothetical protein [Rhizomicrobium sp.]